MPRLTINFDYETLDDIVLQSLAKELQNLSSINEDGHKYREAIKIVLEYYGENSEA